MTRNGKGRRVTTLPENRCYAINPFSPKSYSPAEHGRMDVSEERGVGDSAHDGIPEFLCHTRSKAAS